jgi:very-short-patch-repair endonuclease
MTGSVRHEARAMPDSDVCLVHGILWTSPARTLVDVAAWLQPARTERLLDHSWNRRLVDAASMLALCERLGTRGRPGVKLLRSLVLSRGHGWVAPASNLESRVNHILQAESLGEVERQVNIGGGTWLGRVDFLHPSGVVLEVQSEMFHSSVTSMLDDQQRTDAMRDSGFAVVEVWENEVWLGRFRAAIAARKGAA